MIPQSIDLLIFAVYLILVLAFGVSFYRKKRTAKGFTTGEGRLPAWALGMSVFATYVSSISFLALPGSAFGSNWGGFVFSLSIPIAALISVKFFVPLYRKLGADSAYFFMEKRFGAWARIYASACYLLTQLARMGAILYLLALPMHTLMGWSIPMIIIFTGVLVMIYSALGGIEAVVWTDAIQGVILILGAVICLFTIIYAIPGGWEGFINKASKSNKFSLGEMNLSLKDSSFWLILFYGFFINLQNFGADQSYIQRYVGAKTDRDAKKSVWMGSMLYLPVSLMFFMIGTALWVYYQSFPELLPSNLTSDKVFPHYIVSQLPVGLTGLLIAAIFSAGMSTVSTSINSSATVLLSDYYRKFSKSEVTEKSAITFLRLSSLVMGVLSIIVALAFNGVTSALDAWWALASIFSGGILGLFLLGLFIKNISQKSAIIAVTIGLLFILWASLSSLFGLETYFHSNWVVIIGTLLIFCVGWGLSKNK